MNAHGAGRGLAAAALLLCALPTAAAGQSRGAEPSPGRSAATGGTRPPRPGTVLDVPFVTQTPDLCGGAAAAMVLRYWGRRNVGAEDFRSLVRPELDGIRTDDLAAAVRARGAEVHAYAADLAELRSELDLGRPLVVLLDGGAVPLHYVVIVGWSGGRFLVHDPAASAYRWTDARDLEKRRRPAGDWTMLVLPGEPGVAGGETKSAATVSHLSSAEGRPERPETLDAGAGPECRDEVARAVTLARASRRRDAIAALERASSRCPASPEPLRELAGLYLALDAPDTAATLARSALRLAPGDAYARRVLASARYVEGDADGALRQWNRIGVPEIDLVRVEGARRGRTAPVQALVGLRPGEVLTPAALGAARRRLATLPSARATRLSWRPVGSQRAEVGAAIVERPRLPGGWPALVGLGARAALDAEVRVPISNLIDAGERLDLSWRWRSNRPRVAVVLAVPGSPGVPGVWSVGGAWERQSYDASVVPVRSARDGSVVVEEGRHGRLGFGSWATGALGWSGAVLLDDWDRSGARPGVAGSLRLRLGDGRVAMRVEAESRGVGSGSAGGGERGGVELRWRPVGSDGDPRLALRAGGTVASSDARLGLWSGAGLRDDRGALLRAHPLRRGGVVDGPAFGRVLLHAGIEAERKVASGPGPVRWGVAAFADGAVAAERSATARGAPGQVDVGLGLRLRLPGVRGALALDAAVGLVDGATALSLAWRSAWPSFPPDAAP